MLTTVSGNIFLGYGRTIQCSHCNNKVQEEIVGSTREGGICFIPMRFMTADTFTAVRCPICHKNTPTRPDKNWDKMVELAKREDNKKEWSSVWNEHLKSAKKLHGEFLHLGREKTKEYHKSLNWVQRKTHLNRICRFGFSALAEFLVDK
jgi:hypothetical protein